MANHISALKRMRVERRRTKINRARKTRLRHQVRAMRRFLNDKNGEGAQAALPATYSIVDRAAKWGIIKKNTAARYKARLTGRLKAVLATSAQ